ERPEHVIGGGDQRANVGDRYTASCSDNGDRRGIIGANSVKLRHLDRGEGVSEESHLRDLTREKAFVEAAIIAEFNKLWVAADHDIQIGARDTMYRGDRVGQRINEHGVTVPVVSPCKEVPVAIIGVCADREIGRPSSEANVKIGMRVVHVKYP